MDHHSGRGTVRGPHSRGLQRNSVFVLMFWTVVLLWALVVVVEGQPQCKCTLPSGNTYDLSRFGTDIKTAQDPYMVAPPYLYYFKPCSALPSASCGSLTTTAAVCQQIKYVRAFSQQTLRSILTCSGVCVCLFFPLAQMEPGVFGMDLGGHVHFGLLRMD